MWRASYRLESITQLQPKGCLTMTEKFGTIEMQWIREFLGRLYISNHDEQETLVNLITKIDSVLTKGHLYGTNGQVTSRSNTAEEVRYTKASWLFAWRRKCIGRWHLGKDRQQYWRVHIQLADEYARLRRSPCRQTRTLLPRKKAVLLLCRLTIRQR